MQSKYTYVHLDNFVKNRQMDAHAPLRLLMLPPVVLFVSSSPIVWHQISCKLAVLLSYLLGAINKTRYVYIHYILTLLQGWLFFPISTM